ncbi:MAG: hypothetical protein JST48_00365 [Bacteroidetes bacterium]|nr:hypothetical protein [Bacteroidota bacterium]
MKIKLVAGLLLLSTNLIAQNFSLFTTTLKELERASAISDSAIRTSELQKLWSSLQQQNRIPLVVEDSVAFLYRGNANSVVWSGDFNGWGHDKNFNNEGKKLGASKIWILKTAFPKDARFDYKIIRNGSDYILDPENKNEQWSGMGGGSPNSELRMPLWKQSPEQDFHNDTPRGTVKKDILINSKLLGYAITYSVYLPNGYEKLGKLPAIYVTDGYEYLHPKLGNMATVLDNLIATKRIKPIVGIFIDHREPSNRSNNKRMQELAMNSTYLDFFVKELIPEVEKNYPIISQAKQRAILGTSMGGLTAAYFVFERPDVFGKAGIQSPAFWIKPQIFQLGAAQTNPKVKISMTTGVVNDTGKESRRMKEILTERNCEYHYREVNEGHSWGNWKNLLADVLTDLF